MPPVKALQLQFLSVGSVKRTVFAVVRMCRSVQELRISGQNLEEKMMKVVFLTARARGLMALMQFRIPTLALRRRALFWAAAVGLSTALAFAADVPSLSGPGLAQGPFSSMHMLLEKTILKVDVVNIDVRVSPATQEKLQKAAQGKAKSAALDGELAKILMDSERATIQLTFVRDVPLGMWIDAVRESLAAAEKSGLMSGSVRKQVSDGLPVWFKPVEARGYKDKDRVVYHLEADKIRTVVVTAGGQVLVDRTDHGADKKRIVLTSYFAPGTDYRDLLLKSLK
jgi:hypothetical protein